MIVSGKKALAKIQLAFGVRPLHRGNVLILLRSAPVRDGVRSPTIRTRQGRLLSPLRFHMVPEVLADWIRQEEMKGMQTGKEEMTPTDQVIGHAENPVETIRISETS